MEIPNIEAKLSNVSYHRIGAKDFFYKVLWADKLQGNFFKEKWIRLKKTDQLK